MNAMDADQIEVWCDDTSDADNQVWCVSMCDGDGDEIRCLGTFGDLADAIERGARAAREHGLPLLERGTDGETEELAVAD